MSAVIGGRRCLHRWAIFALYRWAILALSCALPSEPVRHPLRCIAQVIHDWVWEIDETGLVAYERHRGAQFALRIEDGRGDRANAVKHLSVDPGEACAADLISRRYDLLQRGPLFFTLRQFRSEDSLDCLLWLERKKDPSCG
jgi:hypothetical protein